MNPITGEIESHLELNLAQIDLERSLEPTTQLIVQVSDGTYQMERPVLVKIDQNCQEQFKFTQKVWNDPATGQFVAFRAYISNIF